MRWAGLPLVLLDVPLDSRAERAFVAALVARAPDALATMPDGDECAREALGGDSARRVEARSRSGRRHRAISPTCGATSSRTSGRRCASAPGDVRLFSAPGEGREAVEIVRRVLDEAARGVPFDEMAVFLRTPQQYLGLLEHACARGGVPVYFDRGTRRPDPAGRAFVALLSCAVEGLSAKRFDEYLSLGQVPLGCEPAAAKSSRGTPMRGAAAGRGRSAMLARGVSRVRTDDDDPDDGRCPSERARDRLGRRGHCRRARCDRRGSGKS